MAHAAPAPHPADVVNRIPITGALMLATLMNTLDSTIANVALPHMKGSLSASQDQITWVLTSYIIATAIMTPLSGWLAQKIGRKTMFVACITGFTVASALCGVAQNLPEMVLFRFLQGIAGAALIPLSQAVMLDLYPQRLIPQVMSIWSAAVIMGPIIGPAVGGWLTENFSWRWVFYINVPIGALAIFALLTFMADDPGGRQRPFDFLGFGALAVFVGSFQLMMDRGPDQDWFGSPEIVIEAVVAALGFWIFLIQTLTAENPFFHRDLAKDRNFVSCTLFGFCVGAILFSTTAVLPSFMQNLLGYSALQSGYASMPRGVGSLTAFIAMPLLISRVGARRTLVIGIVLCIVALWLMAQFNLDDDGAADRDLRPDPGRWGRHAVLAAEHPLLRDAQPRAPHRGNRGRDHGPQPGLQHGDLGHPGLADQQRRGRSCPAGRAHHRRQSGLDRRHAAGRGPDHGGRGRDAER